MTPQNLITLYESGFKGWIDDPAARESFLADYPTVEFANSGAIALRGSGLGKRALLWRYRDLFDPGAFGQEAQTTGDCTSHGTRNAFDTSRSVEIAVKNEPEEYLVRGATEAVYGARGHGGQGMSVAVAARFITENGMLFRRKYEFADLSKYNASVGIGWGRSGVPAAVKDECRKHPAGAFTKPSSLDDVCDLLFNGYAGATGQNVGFSGTPDKDGCSPRRGTWSHCMATVGYDDTKEIYPERVYFIANSWAKWNSEPKNWPKDLFGPWPHGLIVCRASDYGPFIREAFYYSNIKGFPAQSLPDLGTPSEVLG